jgi:hypothetical protein
MLISLAAWRLIALHTEAELRAREETVHGPVATALMAVRSLIRLMSAP